MIICDNCGAKITGTTKPHSTKEDPYGENTHWCTECTEIYADICREVKTRLKGIYDRAVERRIRGWKAQRIVLNTPEQEV